MSVISLPPEYHETPQNCVQKMQNYVENYFDLTNASAIETALKVITYATLLIPAIVLAIRTCLRYVSPIIPFIAISPEIRAVLDQAPQFRGYIIGNGHNLTSATVRPNNLFFRELLGDHGTTLPGSRQLFAILGDHDGIRNEILEEEGEDFIRVAAGPGHCQVNGEQALLTDLYGENACDISFAELWSLLESQRIYTAPHLPLPFYRGLKAAMQQDQIVTLPGNDAHPVRVRDLNSQHCQAFIQNVTANPEAFGFATLEECQNLLNLTIYQLGSLVVKTENYYLLTNPDGTIRAREAGANDAIRLINACGIRGLRATANNAAIPHRTIMTDTFHTALIAAERGFVVFPAVGMGVWGGDPNLYWRAFLDAIITSATPLEQIFINPGHQTTRYGIYNGHNGSEFQIILNEYKIQYAHNPLALANLNKIVNLYERRTDVLHLSQQLKIAFPDKIVSLFNASDPDVTLGYHVGEYVNNLNHPNTTEENYTALGTNGLLFETITNIHQNPERLIQVG